MGLTANSAQPWATHLIQWIEGYLRPKLWSQQAWVKFCFCHILTTWPWVSYSASPNLSFLVYRMEEVSTYLRGMLCSLNKACKVFSTAPIQGALNKCSDSLLALREIPCRRHSLLEVILGVTFWRRKWQPTPVFLPGKFHGQMSLLGYSLWGHKESDTTEPLHFPSHSAKLQKQLKTPKAFHKSCWDISLKWDPFCFYLFSFLIQ